MAQMREDMFNAGTSAVGVSEQDIPLAFRMVENLPGLSASAGFMAFRGGNTLVEGGRFDYKRAGRRGRALGRKFRVIDEAGKITDINKAQFFGGGNLATGRGLSQGGMLGRRATKRATSAAVASGGANLAGTSNFNLRAARANMLTGNPAAMRRLGSLTSFMGAEKGMYSPFAASSLLGRRGPVRNKAIKGMGLNAVEGQSVFGPGLLSFITAGSKIDRIESKALKGNQRALAKLGRVDQNIRILGGANNAALLAEKTMPGVIRHDLTTQLRVPTGQRVVMNGKVYTSGQFLPGGAPLLEPNVKTGRLHVKKGKVLEFGDKTYYGTGTGPAGRAARKGAGQMVPFSAQYRQVNVSLGAGKTFLDDAMEGAVTGKGVGTVGLRGNLMASSMSGEGTRYMAGYFRGAMGHAGAGGLEGAALRGAEKAAAHLAGKGATRFMALGAKGLGLAIPGLNILATASLVYDLGKMAGEVVKSGINLARDANKSLQGTINKPLFGMGYKDTEAAATSRARGVMAIQNSRLNARSMLGSEAGMMAAHYG